MVFNINWRQRFLCVNVFPFLEMVVSFIRPFARTQWIAPGTVPNCSRLVARTQSIAPGTVVNCSRSVARTRSIAVEDDMEQLQVLARNLRQMLWTRQL